MAGVQTWSDAVRVAASQPDAGPMRRRHLSGSERKVQLSRALSHVDSMLRAIGLLTAPSDESSPAPPDTCGGLPGATEGSRGMSSTMQEQPSACARPANDLSLPALQSSIECSESTRQLTSFAQSTIPSTAASPLDPSDWGQSGSTGQGNSQMPWQYAAQPFDHIQSDHGGNIRRGFGFDEFHDPAPVSTLRHADQAPNAAAVHRSQMHETSQPLPGNAAFAPGGWMPGPNVSISDIYMAAARSQPGWAAGIPPSLHQMHIPDEAVQANWPLPSQSTSAGPGPSANTDDCGSQIPAWQQELLQEQAELDAIEEELRKDQAADLAKDAASGVGSARAGTGLADGSAARIASGGSRLRPWQQVAQASSIPGVDLPGASSPFHHRGGGEVGAIIDQRPLCRFHLSGGCRFGASCLYRHANVSDGQVERAEQVLRSTRDLLSQVAKRETERLAALEASEAVAPVDARERASVLATDRVVPGYNPVAEKRNRRKKSRRKPSTRGETDSSSQKAASSSRSNGDLESTAADHDSGFSYEDLVSVNLCAATGLPEDALRSAEARLSRGLECVVCFDDVVEEGKRFGIQTGCSHCICIECARAWRARTDLPADTVRGCPVCREVTHFVVPCDRFVDHPGRKRELVEEYKASLARIPCKLFAEGEGECPFGTSCFYLHRYPDGTLQDTRPPALVLDQDGRLGPRKDFRLFDAVSGGVGLDVLLGLA